LVLWMKQRVTNFPVGVTAFLGSPMLAFHPRNIGLFCVNVAATNERDAGRLPDGL
jgi:hypothetical protein